MKSGWRIVKLADVCDRITQGPNPKYGDSGDGTVRVLKTKDLYDAGIRYQSADGISHEVFSAHQTAELRTGDILIAIVGQGSINKCNVFEAQPDCRYIFTRALGLIRPKTAALIPHFLKYFLQSGAGKAMVDAGIGGTSGQQVVTTTHLKMLSIPLPPLEEQRRIVSILDEAFEGLSRARANAEANLQSARELFSLNFEHELLASSDGIEETTIGDVCTGFEYGTSAKSLPLGRMPVLRMGNLQSGEIDWNDLVFSDDESDIQKLTLKQGDVLFNRTNSLEHVGKAAVYRGDKAAIFAGYLIRIHFDRNKIVPEFLNLFLNSRGAREYGRSVAGKSINQANISASKLKTYPIRLPPLEVQSQIIKKAEEMRQPLVNVVELYSKKTQDLADLRQSLLQKAFAGELTVKEFA